MSCGNEFRSQWDTLGKTFETHTRRHIQRVGRLHAADTNQILQNELAKWYTTTHFNGAWLHKLQREHPAIAEQVRQALTTTTIAQPFRFSRASLLFLIAVGVIVLENVLLILWLQPYFEIHQLREVLIVVLLTVLGGSFLVGIWSREKAKQVDVVVTDLREGLTIHGEHLARLVAQADRQSGKSLVA